MKEYEKATCSGVLRIIFNRPISLLFFSVSGSPLTKGRCPTVRTLAYVAERLSDNLYPTTKAFLADLDAVFDSCIESDSRTLVSAAAQTLKNECHSVFNALLAEQAPAIGRLRAVQTAIEARASPPPTKAVITERAPAAEFFKPRESPPDLRRLQRDLTLFQSPRIQAIIGAFLTELQPETVLVLGSKITFEIPLMTPETVVRLRAFLDDLFRRIVSAEEDPFECD
jgi:hypothetical protein